MRVMSLRQTAPSAVNATTIDQKVGSRSTSRWVSGTAAACSQLSRPGLGMASRDTGHSRVPAPPAMMQGTAFLGPAAKKPAARKPAVKKPAARKPAVKKPAARKRKPGAR